LRFTVYLSSLFFLSFYPTNLFSIQRLVPFRLNSFAGTWNQSQITQIFTRVYIYKGCIFTKVYIYIYKGVYLQRCIFIFTRVYIYKGVYLQRCILTRVYIYKDVYLQGFIFTKVYIYIYKGVYFLEKSLKNHFISISLLTAQSSNSLGFHLLNWGKLIIFREKQMNFWRKIFWKRIKKMCLLI